MHPIILDLKTRVVKLQSRSFPSEIIRIALKEILQDYALAAIYSQSQPAQMVFIGGTALRKLHQLPRFSEDIDFSCDQPVDFHQLGDRIVHFFNKIDFSQIDYSIQQGALVNRLTLKFPILKDLGLSPLDSEKLHIKIEATVGKLINPVRLPKTFVNFPIIITTYPLETMMASKISACLTRVYKKGKSGIKVKGRDFFDLIWYLEKKITPNLQVFSNLNLGDLSSVISQLDQKVNLIQPNDLLADLQYYFEDPNLAPNWCRNFHSMYTSATQYLRQ